MADDVTRLILQLGSKDARERIGAAEQLRRAGDSARSAATALARAVGDPVEAVSEQAVAALEDMGPPAAESVAELSQLLTDDSADVAYWAATLLGRLGEAAAPAVGPLSVALQGHAATAVRQQAAWALGRIGPSAATALDSLKAAGGSDDPRLARLAREAIERLQS